MNNDLTATVRISEEEIDAIMGYWMDVCVEGDARTAEELAGDRALAVARVRYWDGVYASAYPNSINDNAKELAEQYGVTPEQEIAALVKRGESPAQIEAAKELLGIE